MEITSLNTVIDLSINRDLEWEQKIQTYSDQGLLVVKHLEKGKVKLTTESNGIQILEFDKFSFNYDTMRPITNTRSIKIQSYLGYELIVKENFLIADSEYGYVYKWIGKSKGGSP